jgi:hypothetical protein
MPHAKAQRREEEKGRKGEKRKRGQKKERKQWAGRDLAATEILERGLIGMDMILLIYSYLHARFSILFPPSHLCVRLPLPLPFAPLRLCVRPPSFLCVFAALREVLFSHD